MFRKTPATTPEPDTAPAQTTTAPLVRAEVIAKHFDVHKRTVALWAERGDIPCVRVGGALRFNMEAVLGAIK